MKLLMINGSSNKAGCTFTALSEIAKTLKENGIDSEIVQLGNNAYRDCCGCQACRKNNEGKCIFKDDIVNEIIEKAKTSDAFIFGSPVYFAHPSGRLLSVLDRVFYAGAEYFMYKPGSAVVSARRAGTTASLEPIMKHFTINQMPYISSTYWNMVHGKTAEEVQQDIEGLHTMRTLALNMAWILKSIEAGKNAGISTPQIEPKPYTNFIR